MMTISFLRRIASARAAALLLGALVAAPAMATVNLRVEARPVSDPIQAFVRVTDLNGAPIAGLTSSAFAVTLDGANVALVPSDLTQPPEQNPNQDVSVVFAMDYSPSVTNVALVAMQTAIIDFINNMNLGDFAAIIKFNGTLGATVVQDFTEIDGDGNVGNEALEAALLDDYPGFGTNLIDAVNLAVNVIVTPTVALPPGPKAIVLISDGDDNDSSREVSDVIAFANDNSIAVFSIGVGDLTLPGSTELMTQLAIDTGGEYFPTASDAEVEAAYASISSLLSNEYLITIPSGINDCAIHTLEVAVSAGNQPAPATVQFTRRVCDTEPDPFTFSNQNGVAVNTEVTSNTVTITGLEPGVPTDISTQIGTYSIGCSGTFTGAPGTIGNGQTVCVRHTTSAAASTTNTTTLTIGGIAGTFSSTTRAASGGGGGGGGGATGGAELLLCLLALRAKRRRLS